MGRVELYYRRMMKMRHRKRRKSVIPGFGLSFGIVMAVLGLIVIIPLCSLVVFSAKLTFSEFWETITRPRVLSSYKVSLLTALIASLINAVMGVVLAWVLVRYKFPGKRIMDGIIELPFALPTAVAGIALTHLTVKNGWIGGLFAKAGIDIAYTRVGITVALVFIGIPFVVRSVQPMLEKVDREYEEAAAIFGASRIQIFWRVIIPELIPSIVAGFTMAFARSLGEYGSVVFIAGNTPYETEITPLLIMSELQEYDYASATSIALVMLVIAFVILLINAIIQSRTSRIVKWLLIGLCAVFLVVLLVLPLIYVVVTAIRDGWNAYVKAVTDTYAVKAILLTLEVVGITVVINTIFGVFAAWIITKFTFKGKKVISTLIDLPLAISPIIAGLIFVLTFGRQSFLYPYIEKAGVQIIFAVPGIVLATIFVTFPFISREIIPVLTAAGTDEEEAAAMMGANGFQIFTQITFPHIKWALLYGIVLCSARAMGEFGAVSVLSGHLRGLTNTMPLYIELLYQAFDFTGAFAMSSILVVMAVIILVIRNILEYRGKKEGEV